MAKLSRRAVIAGAASTVAVVAGMASAAVPLDADVTGPMVEASDPDEKILELWRQRQQLEAEHLAVCRREPQEDFRSPAYADWECDSFRAARRVAAIERKIARTPSLGLSGLLVKARLMAEGLDGPECGAYALNGHRLLADLERLAGASVMEGHHG